MDHQGSPSLNIFDAHLVVCANGELFFFFILIGKKKDKNFVSAKYVPGIVLNSYDCIYNILYYAIV